jgi:uncharacterized membrane protein
MESVMRTLVLVAIAAASFFVAGCATNSDTPVAAQALVNVASGVAEGAAQENCWRLDSDAARQACSDRIATNRSATKKARSEERSAATTQTFQDFETYRRERDAATSD